MGRDQAVRGLEGELAHLPPDLISKWCISGFLTEQTGSLLKMPLSLPACCADRTVKWPSQGTRGQAAAGATCVYVSPVKWSPLQPCPQPCGAGVPGAQGRRRTHGRREGRSSCRLVPGSLAESTRCCLCFSPDRELVSPQPQPPKCSGWKPDQHGTPAFRCCPTDTMPHMLAGSREKRGPLKKNPWWY